MPGDVANFVIGQYEDAQLATQSANPWIRGTGYVENGAALVAAGALGFAIGAAPAVALPASAEGTGGVYVLRDQLSGMVVRTGRSIDLLRRQAEHASDAATGVYDFVVMARTDSAAAQRGLEHMLYEQFSEAFLNRIRPVALDNPNLGAYVDAARRFLGGH